MLPQNIGYRYYGQIFQEKRPLIADEKSDADTWERMPHFDVTISGYNQIIKKPNAANGMYAKFTLVQDIIDVHL